MEITDPEITVEVEGFSKSGPKSYILNKMEDTNYLLLLNIISQKNYILYKNKKNYCQFRMFHTRMKAASRISPHNSTPQILNLDPNWVTGFIDAEGSFIVLILRDKNYKLGWTVKPRFCINLHEKDLATLELIKNYFGNVGNISKRGKDSIQYRVASLNDLINIIIPHFSKNPLITQKMGDFLLFKKIIELIKNKEHLTKEGLEKIISIKGSLNLGLSTELKEVFSNINLEKRPKIDNITIQSPYWLAGFSGGEGSFMVQVKKSVTNKSGYSVILEFQLAQHSRDINLMKSIINYLDCGVIYEYSQIVIFKVSKFSDINDKIVPFFNKYPIIGVKYKDFLDFCKVKELMKHKEHLTLNGLEKIKEIKSGMNIGRKIDETNNSSIESNFKQNSLNLTISNIKIQKRGFHSRARAIKRIGPHNEDVISVIVGSLLGDGYANRRYVEGTRICYRQSIIHKDYLFWLYDFFYKRGYCSNLEPRMYTRVLKKKNEEIKHYGYEFNTFTFRSLDWIQKMFYKKGKKVISINIEKYITPLALAIWIMDDGGLPKPGLRIARNSFKLEEVQFLVKILNNKYNLDCTIQELKDIGKYSIYIKGSSISKLRDIVLPHFHPSMHHKLGL